MRDMPPITADELESLAQSLLKLPVGTSQDRLVRALDELRSMLAEDLRRAASTIRALEADLAAERERAADLEATVERVRALLPRWNSNLSSLSTLCCADDLTAALADTPSAEGGG